MSNNLRYRSSQASSKRSASSWQQPSSNQLDPIRQEKRRRRKSSLPVAGVIFSVCALLLVFAAVFNERISGIPHRKLRALLGLGIFFQPDSIDYSNIPQCINNYNDLPELWRPIKIIDANGKPKRLFMNENGEPQAKHPWTEQETLQATRALHQALDEIVRYYQEEMTTVEVQHFQPDGINSLLDMAYGQEGLFHRTALKAARDQFVLVATPFMMHRPPIRGETEREIQEEADKEYDNEDEDEDSKHDYRQEHKNFDNENSGDVEESENAYRQLDLDNEDSQDAEESENEYRHRGNEDSQDTEDIENEFRQHYMHLGNKDSQDADLENDDAVESRDKRFKKELSGDEEEEKDKDDISKDSFEHENRRRLNEETDDTSNSRRYNVHFRDSCSNQYNKMKLAGYGHYIVEQYGREHVQEHDPELDRSYNAILASVREMIHSCGTLDRILQLNLTSELFEDPDEESTVVFDYILSAIALVELSTIPDIDLPLSNASWFVASLWNYLSTYNLKYARDSPQHYWNPETMAHAWLATHIAYLPSGYGRHANKVQDAPYLYQYIRENFYYAMEHGRIDLVSEFVDLIRTYGCSEETDYQLRDGTRFVMNKFYEEMDGQWIDLHSSNSNYNKVHVPWAGSAAVMLTGDSEPTVPGSYGYAFYAMLRSQDSQDSQDDITQM